MTLLSQAERNFLLGTKDTDKGYAYVLEHRIRVKLQALTEDLTVLQDHPKATQWLTEACKGLTRFRKTEGETSRETLSGLLIPETIPASREVIEWTGRDLNPRPCVSLKRPSACEADTVAPPLLPLNYRPTSSRHTA